MYILGINKSHTATAALLKDGKLIAVCSEERFTRNKGQGGFPTRSIDFCLKFAGISSEEVDLLVIGGKDVLGEWVYEGKRKGSFLIKLSQAKYWLMGFLYQFLPFVLNIYQFLAYFFYDLVLSVARYVYKFRLSRSLGLPISKIIFIDHHLAHAYAAYYIFGQTQNKRLVITNDGIGDQVCGRAFIVQDNTWKEIASTSNSYSPAWFYYQVTKFLGFKPNEEEYKVMGLSPYAYDHPLTRKLLDKFRKLIWCQGLSFKSQVPASFYLSFLKTLPFTRFDVIAAAAQRLIEELVVEQIETAVDQTKIREVLLGGGLYMNVKANMRIAKLPGVKNLLVCPTSSDESTAIGACFWGYKRLCQKRKVQFNPHKLDDLYLGPSYSENDIKKALDKEKVSAKKYDIKKINPSKIVAGLLAKGKVVARFAGRMEFGARALGNRSILADPRHPKVVKVINDSIKGRDFWMPFAPTILYARSKDYLVNPKKIDSPFMMMGFHTTNKAQLEIPATLHPHDLTCRPQILKREDNPIYYDIIREFEKLTGVGAILNTSFNLHGEPIVLSPDDAINTFKKSNLEYLLIGDYLIRKQ